MQFQKRNPKDLWTGVLFIVMGLAAVYFAQSQPIGTAMRMGPAYFPTMLGLLLAVIGIALVVRSFLRTGSPLGTFALGKVAWIVGSIFLFGLLLRGMGLLIAIIVIVIHGVALNVAMDLEPFERIHPCGYAGTENSGPFYNRRIHHLERGGRRAGPEAGRAARPIGNP